MVTSFWRGCQVLPRPEPSRHLPRTWSRNSAESSLHRIYCRATLRERRFTPGKVLGGTFQFRPGPVFGNLILADEINRAPAKAQAALLESMEERQVTVAGKTHKLPDLFLVLATQNPIEQEGTYPLPEAQMDRFLMHVFVGYSTEENERKILRLIRGEDAGVVVETEGKIPSEAVFQTRGGIARCGAAGLQRWGTSDGD
jgi:MoxR-like ATPase